MENYNSIDSIDEAKPSIRVMFICTMIELVRTHAETKRYAKAAMNDGQIIVLGYSPDNYRLFDEIAPSSTIVVRGMRAKVDFVAYNYSPLVWVDYVDIVTQTLPSAGASALATDDAGRDPEKLFDELFRMQEPDGTYLVAQWPVPGSAYHVDFAQVDKRSGQVVALYEIDGNHHRAFAQMIHDARRDQFIMDTLKLRVVRIPARDVFEWARSERIDEAAAVAKGLKR